VKLAVTDLEESILRVQIVPEPEHAPPQPANEYPDAAVAVSVTDVERG
jgi:hypothetical protein